jgi:succinate dehydrogenase / fumarate reductase membrane anchor subunit
MLRKTTRPRDNFELRSWIFMRVSGALIVFFVLIHLAFVHFIHGVDEINYRFVSNRWATPTWRTFDIILLVLAYTHGANGVRIMIDDYIRPKGWRRLALVALYTVSFLILALGVVVMLTFKAR